MFFSFLLKVADDFFRQALVLAVKTYRMFLSPVLGSNCRFHPTCSQYALEALGRYSFLRATTLLSKRIFKCHPYSAGGYDPVKK